MRVERVELSSARSAGEVRARIEAASRRVGWYGWTYSSGVVRRHRRETIRLAVAHGVGDPWRPVASVVVQPSGSGARVSAEIGIPPGDRVMYAAYGVAALLVALVLLVRSLATRHPGPLVVVLGAGVMFVAFRRLTAGDRDVLRALLADAAS